jgi:hypothetical protein
VELAPFLNVSAATLLAGVVWYLLRQISTGQWVPRRELDYMRADRDARLVEKDVQIARERAAAAEWRAAHETEQRSREILVDQIRDIAGAIRDQSHFYDVLRDILDGDNPTGA